MISPAASSRRRQGMALLAVLLLVMAISAIAVGLLDHIRFGQRRAANAQNGAQAQWIALSAEGLAQRRIKAALDLTPGRFVTPRDWRAPLDLPLDEGRIVVRLEDRGACFNLNSLVAGPAGAAIASPAGAAQFSALLQALAIAPGQARRLTAALTDWLDADAVTEPFGAEDEAYLRRTPSYRTGGGPLAEVSELRAVSGFTPAVYERLRPHVCALPRTGPSQINLNTLPAESAVVLVALYGGGLSEETARRLIAARPPQGWPSEGAFFDQPLLAEMRRRGISPPLQQLTLTSDYFALDATVDHAGAQARLSALLEYSSAGVRTVARRWSPEE